MKLEFVDIRPEHLEMVRQWRNSEEVKKYMYTEQYISQEDQIRWFESIKSKKDEKHWIIEAEGKSVGVVNLKKINLTNLTAEWAFYLGDISVRGGGIGVLTEYQLLNVVFDNYKLTKLSCAVLDFNAKVIEMHKKFGFSEEGRLRNQYIKNGESVDVVLLGITADKWGKQRETMSKMIERLIR
jgi:hypothetical protein